MTNAELEQEIIDLQYKLNTRPRIICDHVICDGCLRTNYRPCEHVACPACAMLIQQQDVEYDRYIQKIWANEELLGGLNG